MTEAAESADLAPAERLHPLILLTGLGGSLRGMAGGYAGIGYLAATGRIETALIAGAVLLAFLAAGLVIYWRRFEYRVGAHEIRIDSGILSRTHRSIPFDRVQDVDISQGPVARLLGLAKVRFETGASAGSEEGALPAISLDRAEALREHIRKRRGLQPAVSAEQAEDAAPLFAMHLKRVLTAGVFNFSLAIFAGLFGATQTFGDVLGFDPFEREFWDGVLTGNPIANYIAAHRTVAVIAGFGVLLLAGMLTGIIRTLLRDFRFRLDRTGTGLRRRRGLFTLTDVTLPLRRVQAALILTGPVRERFGWRELKFQSLARDEEAKSGDHVVAPLATSDEILPILKELGWQPVPVAADWEGVSRAYIWSLAIGLSPLLLLAICTAGLLGFTPLFLDESLQEPVALAFAPVLIPSVLLILALLLAVAARWLAWRRTGFLLRSDSLIVRTGWWRRRTLLLPLEAVQSIDISQNALQRRFGVATLTIGVAGGQGFSGHSIPALPLEKARQIRKALLSRFA